MEASFDEDRPGDETGASPEALGSPDGPPEPTSPDGLRWWQRALAEADSREFAARRRARDLSRELAEARIEEGRASARLQALSDQLAQAASEAESNANVAAAQARLAAARDAELSAARAQLRALKAERRVLANRSEKLAGQLNEIRSSRAYGLMRLIWKVKGAPAGPSARSGVPDSRRSMTPSRGLSVCMLVQRTIEHDSRVRREAAALAQAGHRVTVVEMSPTGPPVTGFQRRRLPGSSLLERLPLRMQQPVAVLAFALEACRRRPDVVHAHDVLMLPAGQLAARLSGAHLVYDAHELATGVAYRRGLLARVAGAVERLGIRRARVVLTVSEPIAARLRSAYGLPRPPLVLRNVCALPRPPSSSPAGLRESLGIGDRPLVLHQGAATEGRGCETLVRALRDVPGAGLVFLGPCDDDYRASLQALASEAGCAERLHFLPPVPPESLLEYTSEADVGVSLFEPTCENYRLTIPNKLFEYVAAGVPVVASNVAGVGGLVRDTGIGWTADPLDASSVAEALRRTLDVRGDEAGRQRLAEADARFSWESERSVLLEAYRSMSSS